MERHPLYSATSYRLKGRWQPPIYFPLGHFALQTGSTSEGQDRVRGCHLQELLGIGWFGGQFASWNFRAIGFYFIFSCNVVAD